MLDKEAIYDPDYSDMLRVCLMHKFQRGKLGDLVSLLSGRDFETREFKEEINIDIEIKDFLGVSENMFTFEGKNAHELVFYYNINVLDKDYKEEYILTDDDGESKAVWINIDDFKNGSKILYPEEIFKYL